MGIRLFILSILLGATLLPLGILYGFFKCFYHRHIGDALNSSNAKLIVLATAFDKYGGVVCSELFNDALITKDSQYRFGDIRQTVSQVIGYNLLNNTLSNTGLKVNKVLDAVFGPGHAINSTKIKNIT